MTNSRWPSVLAALLASCMLLAAPMNADAANAPSDSKKSNAASPAAKSSSSDASRISKGKDAKRQSSAKEEKELRTSSRKQKKNADTVAEAPKSVDSRHVWLKRAQESEMLTGKASWYGRDFHGGPTASGLAYDMYTFTAAHRTLPMGTVVRVTDHANGKSVMVCVTDRGPFVRGRIIDLSYAAANQLDLGKRGVSKVDLEVVSDESGTPLNADQAYYVRYNAVRGDERIGPFRAFVDAAAMHEAMLQAHPEAEVVLDSKGR